MDPSGTPRLPSQPASSRHLRRPQRWTFGPFETAYKKLPWTTRQTIRSSVSLCAVLYVFFTFPFRIAFYYDPFSNGETITHGWTEELSIFAAMDAVADLIGIVEFLRFYNLQKKVFGPRFASFDSDSLVFIRIGRYDDVTPVSDAETIYALVVTLMGALFGSSLLATFLFIFRFRNARYAAFSTHVDNAREYMRSQNIPRSVRRQVIAYFSYAWNTHHSLDSEEALHLMPRHLQSKVVSTLKASRIKQLPSLPETFEEKAVAKTFCELYVLAKSKFDEAMPTFTGKTRSSRRRGVDWRLAGSVFRIHWDAWDNFRVVGDGVRPEIFLDVSLTSPPAIAFPVENPDSMYQASFAYMRSVYWAIVTLTAVGYGDIVAYSTAESFFAAFWVFVGGIINFGVVGAMSSTISNAMAPHHHHMEKLNTLNSILERMDISEKLSAEIRRFYHHAFTGRKQAYESQLLSHLPDQLCYEISKVPIRALHEGDSYGVMAFLLKRGHPATLTAASLVHASVMTREQFDVIQRKFDDDLNDMKEEAETLWVEQQKNMRLIVRNLERLKLQPHMMSTSTLFYQGDTTTTTGVGAGKESKAVRDVNATREVLSGLWKTIIMCCNVYNTIFVIVRICFHSHLHYSSGTSTAVWVADLCCDICFALDIYLRLYYFGCPEVGLENLVQRKEVDKQYRRSSTLKWDVLASLPIYTPFASGSLIASLCRVPRLVRCVNLWTYLDDAIVLIQQHFASHNVSAYLSPVKLMIILVLMAHYVGCIFFWISEQECEHVEQCWMAHDHMLHQYHHSVPMLYAKSFYWAITTLLLVGSRESVPRDTAGTLWTGFTCLCCTFIIGHIVGEISELILELGKEVKQYKSRIASFDGFAKEHELSDGLRKRVGFFFREQFEHTKGTDLHHTVHDLSANLRLKLMLEIYGHSIMLLPIRRFLTSPQINNLALRLKSEIFIPGDNILVEGTFGSRLCTLRRGIAAAFWTSSVTSVAILMEGALFGEVAFFLAGQRRLATVRATTACEVLFVTKHDWQELWTSTGDTSDIQIQKHAQHALFNWVRVRLLRYERASLRAASKAKRLLSSRHTFHSTAAAAAGTAKARTKLSAVLLHHRESSDVGASTLSQLTPPQRNGSSQSLVDSRRTSVASEMQILERKTKYLQAKTDKCAKKFYPAIEALHTHRRASSIMSGKSLRSSISHSRSRGNSSGVSGVYRSMIGDTVTPIARNNSITTLDIRLVQFIVDTNPINKYVRDSLSDEHIREIEKECWTRFKLLAVAQFGVSRLLEELAPTEMIFSQSSSASGSADQRAPAKIQSARNNKLHRTRSLRYDENTKRKRSMDALVVAASNRRGSGPKAAKKWKALAVAAAPRLSSLFYKENVGGLRGRRFSIHAQEPRDLPKTEQSARLSRMALQMARTDLKAKKFIKTVQQMGKTWDILMLLVALYHLIVTPFKLDGTRKWCFDTIKLTAAWNSTSAGVKSSVTSGYFRDASA
ncbi:Cyclic nucleotide-binding-like [Phytophthora cactorum]|nr:Cyclic nucleotide-binding-like [Phytophthora cactorum]